MSGRAPFLPRRGLALVAAALVLAALAVRIDRASLERGNRLYREGAVEDAAAVYTRHAASRGAGATEAYNAGTAELALTAPEADAHLMEASASADSVVAHRAHYNLGYRYLTAGIGDLAPDSAIALARAAIEHTRIAIRLDPTGDDARWNLALAQARLDSLTQLRIPREDVSSPGDDETPIDLESMTRGPGEARSGIEPENARAGEVLGQRLAAAQGAREAWAIQDPGPLTEQAARGLLQEIVHDPEQLIRGLMWAHRPDVAWWNSEPYPGGNW